MLFHYSHSCGQILLVTPLCLLHCSPFPSLGLAMSCSICHDYRPCVSTYDLLATARSQIYPSSKLLHEIYRQVLLQFENSISNRDNVISDRPSRHAWHGPAQVRIFTTQVKLLFSPFFISFLRFQAFSVLYITRFWFSY